MLDPEVARLRRLRSAALLAREIARMLDSARGATEPLLERAACASWRIARLVSGRLRNHPYERYQSDPGVLSLARNRVWAWYLSATSRDRRAALRALEARLDALAKQLDDTVALAWSSDFSDAMRRAQAEIHAILEALAQETRSGVARGPLVPHAGADLGELAPALEGDWPYLAF